MSGRSRSVFSLARRERVRVREVPVAVDIRQVTELRSTEIEELGVILIRVVEAGASVGFLPPLSRDAAADYWSDVLQPGVDLIVAEVDGRIVGTAQLQRALRPNARHRAEVAKVLVHPEFQRRGIGRSLLRAIEVLARADGRTLLVLDTREGDPSNELYRSVGYAEAGRIPNYARSANGELHATVFYYKILASDGGA